MELAGFDSLRSAFCSSLTAILVDQSPDQILRPCPFQVSSDSGKWFSTALVVRPVLRQTGLKVQYGAQSTIRGALYQRVLLGNDQGIVAILF